MRISDWSSDVCSSDLVTLLYHSWFSDCVMEGDRVSHVIVQNKAGRVAYAADIFIDCTGDADLVRAAGFPTTKGDVLQPATLWFQLGGVDTDALAHLFRDSVDGMLPVSEVIRTRLLHLHEQDEMPIFGGPCINKFFHQLGRAHVCTPVTNSQIVCRLLLGKKYAPNRL